MELLLVKSVFLLVAVTCSLADPIDRAARTGAVLKMLREMVNQTKADTLNLPANATSIRENITDTFSCENRTYGYYADVDNECQVFHVCLTSQGASGRNTTYRWSFICPQETVFNQEVLVCTRPRESIPCEESPQYYDLNMEIGKVPTDTEGENTENADQNAPPPKRNFERIPVNNQRKQTNRKKQNIIVEELMKEAMKEMETINEDIVESQGAGDNVDVSEDSGNSEAGIISLDRINIDDIQMSHTNEAIPVDTDRNNMVPVITSNESNLDIPEVVNERDEDLTNTRLATERSFKRTGRKYRGSIKFKNDI